MQESEKEHVSHLVLFISELPKNKGRHYMLLCRSNNNNESAKLNNNSKGAMEDVLPKFSSVFFIY